MKKSVFSGIEIWNRPEANRWVAELLVPKLGLRTSHVLFAGQQLVRLQANHLLNRSTWSFPSTKRWHPIIIQLCGDTDWGYEVSPVSMGLCFAINDKCCFFPLNFIVQFLLRWVASHHLFHVAIRSFWNKLLYWTTSWSLRDTVELGLLRPIITRATESCLMASRCSRLFALLQRSIQAKEST